MWFRELIRNEMFSVIKELQIFRNVSHIFKHIGFYHPWSEWNACFKRGDDEIKTRNRTCSEKSECSHLGENVQYEKCMCTNCDDDGDDDDDDVDNDDDDTDDDSRSYVYKYKINENYVLKKRNVHKLSVMYTR
jgi:hypothetical protein